MLTRIANEGASLDSPPPTKVLWMYRRAFRFLPTELLDAMIAILDKEDPAELSQMLSILLSTAVKKARYKDSLLSRAEKEEIDKIVEQYLRHNEQS